MASLPATPGGLLGPLFVPPPRAAFATRPETSRGRFFPEPESATRTCYQRDRDRIVHSTSFRRLKHKTQVFVHHEGDYYRTRLTHSLEVAQIARSAARRLGLDEDLAETLALSHDLGHPPFGHAGEEALNACMAGFGGFDHNAQALKLVTRLEHHYPEFDGLNLTWETLEGLVKHNGPVLPPLPEAIARFEWDLELASHAGPEAQIAALADDIAYINHDIDDGLRAELFALADIFDAPLAGPAFRETAARYPEAERGRMIAEAVRSLIGQMVGELVAETQARLTAWKPPDVAAVRNLLEPVAAFRNDFKVEVANLKAFLYQRMYRHTRVLETMRKAQNAVTGLFEAFTGDPSLMPAEWADVCGTPRDSHTARAVCDYIAGMTDRFALQEHARIFRTEISA